MEDRCYKFHATPKSWYDAYKTCSAEQAHLVILNSDQEAQDCLDMFKKYGKRTGNYLETFVWFGFSSLVVPEQFKTIEGMFL